MEEIAEESLIGVDVSGSTKEAIVKDSDRTYPVKECHHPKVNRYATA